MGDCFLSVKKHEVATEYIQKSKFISQIFPISFEDEAIEIINEIKKNHYKASHNVYSYILGENKRIQKSSDDGEPSGTAGVPILEILRKENLNYVLIVVTRYFGGIKLGASGLIRAYAHMAKLAIGSSQIVKNVLCEKIQIEIDYTYWGRVENEVNNRKLNIYKTEFSDKVKVYFYLQDFEKKDFYKLIKEITNGDVLIKSLDREYIILDVK